MCLGFLFVWLFFLFFCWFFFVVVVFVGFFLFVLVWFFGGFNWVLFGLFDYVFFEGRGWKGAGGESHNLITQHVAGLVIRISYYMKGCCERHKLQVISSNFYLSGNKKRLDYILSTGEAEMLPEVPRPPLVSCFRRLRSV